MQFIYLHKEIVLHKALRYNFALLSPARLSQFAGENSLPADAFSRKVFQQDDNFLTG